MSATRVLVADSHDIFRSGVRSLLMREGKFAVVEASDLAGLLARAAERCPDVALVDLDLPPADGLVAVEELRRRCPCQIVVWSFEPTCETVLEAIRAGANGYLERTVAPHALVRALRATLDGEAALPRHLVAALIEALHAFDERVRARERAVALSAREREVLGLLAAGAANRQIAATLAISEFTVKRHVQNILNKLQLQSRRQAASFWTLALASGTGARVDLR